MNTYLLTFTDGTTETVHADEYQRWDGLITLIDGGRNGKRYIEANLRSLEKVSR